MVLAASCMCAVGWDHDATSSSSHTSWKMRSCCRWSRTQYAHVSVTTPPNTTPRLCMCACRSTSLQRRRGSRWLMGWSATTYYTHRRRRTITPCYHKSITLLSTFRERVHIIVLPRSIEVIFTTVLCTLKSMEGEREPSC